MNYAEISKANLLVPATGSGVTIFDRDGTVVFETHLEAGLHKGADLARFMEVTDAVAFDANVLVRGRGDPYRVRAQAYGERAAESGANPDFRPRRLGEEELRMRHLVEGVQRERKATQAMLAQVQRLAASNAPEPRPATPEPVLDPVPDDSVAVEPEPTGGDDA